MIDNIEEEHIKLDNLAKILNVKLLDTQNNINALQTQNQNHNTNNNTNNTNNNTNNNNNNNSITNSISNSINDINNTISNNEISMHNNNTNNNNTNNNNTNNTNTNNTNTNEISNNINNIGKQINNIINNKDINIKDINVKNKNINKNGKSNKSSKSNNNNNTLQLYDDNQIINNLGIDKNDINNMSKDNFNKILFLLKQYINMDNSYKFKHETLKTLYMTYIKLYKKYNMHPKLNIHANPLSLNHIQTRINTNGNRVANLPYNSKNIKQNTHYHNLNMQLIHIPHSQNQNQTNNIFNNNTNYNNTNYNNTNYNNTNNTNYNNTNYNNNNDTQNIFKNIHIEMKNNNAHMYRERIMILKKIKEEPTINLDFKNKICGRLIALFRLPNMNNKKTNDFDTIDIDEMDTAYLRKHNELITVFKAYKTLYSKVLNYKEQIDTFARLSRKSSISRGSLNRMLKDQASIMNSIDKMQDKLVDDNIIDNSEKVLLTPVINNPENIDTFNTTARTQINNIIERQNPVKSNVKNNIEFLINI